MSFSNPSPFSFEKGRFEGSAQTLKLSLSIAYIADSREKQFLELMKKNKIKNKKNLIILKKRISPREIIL